MHRLHIIMVFAIADAMASTIITLNPAQDKRSIVMCSR